jgi:hypothetical protein
LSLERSADELAANLEENLKSLLDTPPLSSFAKISIGG